MRRALELLRDDGLIAARQGFGWFVVARLVRQRLEHLGTIEDQLAAGGLHAERKVTEFAFLPAPARVRRELDLDDGEQVLRVERVNLADGEPFALVTVWCPAAIGQRLSRDDVERRPFYELLDVPLRGATQTIGADAATAAEARLLEGARWRTGPALPARHHRHGAGVPSDQRARLPRPPHGVRRRPPLAEPSISPAGLRLIR